MITHNFLNDAANIIILAGALPLALFVGFYGFRSPWRKHLVGRSLMLQSVALLLVVILNIIGLWWPDMPGRPWVRVAVYGFLFLALWQMFFTLLHYQNQPFTTAQAETKESLETKD